MITITIADIPFRPGKLISVYRHHLHHFKHYRFKFHYAFFTGFLILENFSLILKVKNGGKNDMHF